ncbi:retrotransposon domain containing protein [Lasius niger]|uniref:Retrotransposon domain containing protein n=1 Tax=Lasius niger TaxID=67767 RepID=A0A0J7K0R3_LASNI|nr:retrotransposon domain containing protein [Lasius niger]
MVVSMFEQEANVADLWRLDTLGITDPIESVTKEARQAEIRTLFQDTTKVWLAEEIIEKVPVHQVSEKGYYLPHRPVIKEGSTTRIRPVFDASAKTKDSPPLNQCLETGPNLIKLIPTIIGFGRGR